MSHLSENTKSGANATILAFKIAAVEIMAALCKDIGAKAQNTNSSGDSQLKIDILADKIVSEKLLKIKEIKKIASEEQENAQNANENGFLCVAYDPLDGSSLMGANLSVGSIFGIYENDFSAQNLITAGYIIYGPTIGLCIASEYSSAVEYFVYDKQNGEFQKQKELKLEKNGKLNAPGSTQCEWSKKHKALIDELFSRGYRLRYSGGMVPDLHQILCKGGGLFSYPAGSSTPNGKLRKLYEVFPFAYIYEKAGGRAVSGDFGEDGKLKRLLSLPLNSLHERSSCYFGSQDEIALCEQMLK